MTKIVGVDVGFGFTKATNGRDAQVFKSLIGEANPSPFDDSLTGLPSEFPRGISFEDGDYFVGELADEYSVNRVASLDFAQHLAQEVRPLAFAGLLPFCPSGEPVCVVTGLPVSTYRKYESTLQEMLTGEHHINVILGEHDRREHILNIERVRVIPQPFGSLYSLMLDEHGAPTNRDMLEAKYAVIDVGMKTCDYAICNHSRYTERGSRSSENGISDAYKAIIAEIESTFDIEVELFRLNRFMREGKIKLRDKIYDLKPIRDQVFGDLAKRIAVDAEVLWQKDWDARSVLVTGGGGADLFPYLKTLIHNDVEMIRGEEDPRLNNVIGYQRYGAFVWANHVAERGTSRMEAGRGDSGEEAVEETVATEA